MIATWALGKAPGELRAAAAGDRERQRAISAAVEKPEDQHKPERFFGHRKVGSETRGGPLRRAGESPLFLPVLFILRPRGQFFFLSDGSHSVNAISAVASASRIARYAIHCHFSDSTSPSGLT